LLPVRPLQLDVSGLSGLVNGGQFTLTITGQNLVLNFNPVPEPATVLLIGAAGLGVAGLVRRRLGRRAV
jgi:hypothetical protein